MMLPAEMRLWVVEHKPVTSVKAGEMSEWYDQATCRCQGWTCRKLAQKCTICGKVGLEECTCLKEKAKEGGRQRGIVCYTPRHTARSPNNGALWRERCLHTNHMQMSIIEVSICIWLVCMIFYYGYIC